MPLFDAPVEISSDLDGWTATISGAAFNPILVIIGLAHFAMGSTFAIGGLVTLVTSLLAGELFFALVALPFTLVGSVFASWPPVKAYQMAHSTRIEVSGRSLRLERSVFGISLQKADMDLAACGNCFLSKGKLEIGEHRFPVSGGEKLEQVVSWIEAGAKAAALDAEQLPPVPSQLQALRSGTSATKA